MMRSSDKKIEGDSDDARGDADGGDERKRLLARVAAHVAASVVLAPSKKVTSPEAIAEISVDVAEAILRRVGL